MKGKALTISMAILAIGTSCKKEYITNEYITNNEYVTNVYDSEYYSTILNSQEEITQDIRPAYLKEGDSVAVCAASNAVSESDIAGGIKRLEEWGLKVKLADNVYAADGRYAGSIGQRVEGLQKIIDNENIKAIFMARGGYGASQILPYVDFKPMQSNPKWVIGYSDVTALHIALNNLGVESIHGPMMVGFTKDEESVNSLKDALFGKYQKLTIESNKNCVNGTAEGRLVGGNLSLIYSEGGTLFDLNVKGAILFIEDTGEANYAVDRMLTNLKLSGKLDGIRGIVIGEFINGTQGSDKSIEEIIKEKVGDLSIPVMYGLKSGHDTKNLPLYFGRTVKLTVNDTNATLEFK